MSASETENSDDSQWTRAVKKAKAPDQVLPSLRNRGGGNRSGPFGTAPGHWNPEYFPFNAVTMPGAGSVHRMRSKRRQVCGRPGHLRGL